MRETLKKLKDWWMPPPVAAPYNELPNEWPYVRNRAAVKRHFERKRQEACQPIDVEND